MALQFGADSFISNNEKTFIQQALRAERRIDGRTPYEHRPIQFQFALDDRSCTVLLGSTRVMAVITATLEPPFPDRPSEGSLRFNVDYSPMASPAFDAVSSAGRPREDAIELARLIERGLRESRAVDLEALCVQAGRKVWHLRADITILDHCGNLIDACGLAALAALCAFRRPDVTVTTADSDAVTSVTIHSIDEKEPVALTIHHLPFPVTFALFDKGQLLVVDPSLKEEAAAEGGMTVTINPAGEMCAVQKADGVGLSLHETMRCVRLAARTSIQLAEQLKQALSAHEVARVQARIRRKQPPSSATVNNNNATTGTTTDTVIKFNEKPSGLPVDIQRAVDLANASDTTTTSEEQGDKAEAAGIHGGDVDMQTNQQQEQQEDDYDMDLSDEQKQQDGATVTEGIIAEEDGGGGSKKKRKRRRAGGDASDGFGAVAQLVADKAGPSQSSGGGDLKSAVKKKGGGKKKQQQKS